MFDANIMTLLIPDPTLCLLAVQMMMTSYYVLFYTYKGKRNTHVKAKTWLATIQKLHTFCFCFCLAPEKKKTGQTPSQYMAHHVSS